MTKLAPNNQEYFDVLNALKTEIKQARIRAHLSVNRELVLLYWRIGKEILDRQRRLGWGSKVIDQLSLDLKHEFPEMKGLSSRNLVYMQTFARVYSDVEFTQQVAAQIPWFHHCIILDKIKNYEEKTWYIQKTIENGWSRNVLVMQIDRKLYERQGKAITNFKYTLPTETSDLAQQLFKSEYNFEFLGLTSDVHERHIERSLVDHIRDFLLELGTGFAFMGSQHRVRLAGEEFYIDLLFYHTRLRCYVVIELKAGKFIPEYAGKLSFYLTAIDRELKHSSDNPTIGLLLCQSANQMMIEYCLADMRKPLGVSQYRATTSELPKELINSLPTPEQFQHFFKTINNDTLKEEQARVC